jgi:hypothetical protein
MTHKKRKREENSCLEDLEFLQFIVIKNLQLDQEPGPGFTKAWVQNLNLGSINKDPTTFTTDPESFYPL